MKKKHANLVNLLRLDYCGVFLIRQKYRWLALEIVADKPVEREKFISALRRKIYELFGSFGDAVFRVEEYDSKRGFCIIKCLRDDLRRLRVALMLLREIDGAPVVVNDLYCSGTLRKLKEELEKRQLFVDKLEEYRLGSK